MASPGAVSAGESAVVVRDLRKSYGDFEAVRGVSFEVARGESVAFLGPNGAGKTTTVEILEGYREPSAGTVSVLGLSPTHDGPLVRRRVGIVLQEAGFPQELTVVELVEAWRRFYERPLPTGEVIDIVGLSDRRDVRAKNLSGGEARRLDLALGIVGQPEVLFLDEPTTGFDPAARRAAWELIGRLIGTGVTVFLTTHYLEEAQTLADRILIIAAGHIIAEGNPEEIGGRQQAAGMVRFHAPPGVGFDQLRALPGLPGDAVVAVGPEQAVTITSRQLVHTSHAVTSWALERNLDLLGFTVERPSLDDIYLSIIDSTNTTSE